MHLYLYSLHFYTLRRRVRLHCEFFFLSSSLFIFSAEFWLQTIFNFIACPCRAPTLSLCLCLFICVFLAACLFFVLQKQLCLTASGSDRGIEGIENCEENLHLTFCLMHFIYSFCFCSSSLSLIWLQLALIAGTAVPPPSSSSSPPLLPFVADFKTHKTQMKRKAIKSTQRAARAR